MPVFSGKILPKSWSKGIAILQFVLLLVCLSALYPPLSKNSTIAYHAEPTTETEIRIPLKQVGNLLIIDAKADSLEGAFVFDTGAPGLVLNSNYFKDGRKVFDVDGGGVTGGNIVRQTKMIGKFSFNVLKFNKIKADVIDLSHIENSRGIKILGLIGTGFFEDYEMLINTRELSLCLRKIDKKGNLLTPAADTLKYDVEGKIQYVNSVIVVKLAVGEDKLSFCFDTGAENNLLHSSQPAGVMKNFRVTGRKVLKGSGKQQIEVLNGRIQGLSIGGYILPEMDIMLTDLGPMQAAYGLEISGMLGHPFLRQGIIKINPGKKLINIAFRKEETL